ncbi:hypothetical protein E4U53_004622 [Claviceps sorghi]|nr:hypothetical protein E4U53_004622 [Claviceps sorghi]
MGQARRRAHDEDKVDEALNGADRPMQLPSGYHESMDALCISTATQSKALVVIMGSARAQDTGHRRMPKYHHLAGMATPNLSFSTVDSALNRDCFTSAGSY